MLGNGVVQKGGEEHLLSFPMKEKQIHYNLGKWEFSSPACSRTVISRGTLGRNTWGREEAVRAHLVMLARILLGYPKFRF